jgi:tetratricopeptide (TPR) repeat protein
MSQQSPQQTVSPEQVVVSADPGQSHDSSFERRLFFVLGAVALIYAFLAAYATVGDPDFGWQLARGRWMVQHHQIFTGDVLSYTIPGVPAVYPAFAGIVLYLIYALGGYTLLCLACAVTCAGTVALLLRRGNAINAALAILVVPYMAMRSVPRSELLAIPLFAAYISILWQHFQTGRAKLWLLPVLMVVWVNVHFSFFSGFGLLAAFGGANVLELLFAGERRTLALQRLKEEIPWFLATVVATLVNPWGWKIYKDTAQYTGLAMAIKVNEWAPLHWNLSSGFSLRNTNDLAHVLVVLVLLAIATALLQSRIGTALLLIASLYEVTRHLRYMALASCMFVIVGGSVLYTLVPWIRAHIANPKLRAALATAAAVVFVGIGVMRAADVVSNYHYLVERNLSTFGGGLAAWFPSRASEFIRKQNLPGEVFNTYDEGGYTLWALGPERRDYIDGREIPFGEALINHASELAQAPLDSDMWRKESDRYNINTIIFPLVLDEVSLGRLHTDCYSKEWAVVYLDEVSIVLVRRKPENQDLIRRFEVDCASAPLPRERLPLKTTSFQQYVNAARVLVALGRPTEALAASDKAMSIFPDNAHARWYRGQIFFALHRDDEAEQEWKRALELTPREITPWGSLPDFQGVIWSSLADAYSRQERINDAAHAYEEVVKLSSDPVLKATAMVNLGAVYHTLGRDKDAEAQWKAALALVPTEGAVWMSLADIYQGQKRWADAAHAYEQGLPSVNDPKTKARAYIQLARAYLITHQPQKALQALDDAAKAAPPDLLKEKTGRSFSFDVAQGHAAVYSSMGDLKQATVYEEEAVALDPTAPDAWAHLARLYEKQGRTSEQQRAEERGKLLLSSNGAAH